MPVLVLYTDDVAETAKQLSPLTFQPEKHGTGPDHFSCEIGGIVVEVYPSSARRVAQSFQIIGDE